MDLQRKAGNAATAALLAAGQAKLAVSPAGDRYEREADAIAAEVVARLRSGPARQGTSPAEYELSAPVAVMASREPPAGPVPVGPEGGELAAAEESRIHAARQGGTPLPQAVRRAMEGAFGADFSGVRLHTGAEAESLNRSVGAIAFTVGHDIFLGRTAPQLSSPSGQSLLAHELAHTIQQGAARHAEQVAVPQRSLGASGAPVQRFAVPAGYDFKGRAALPPSMVLEEIRTGQERHHIISDQKILAMLKKAAEPIDEAWQKIPMNQWARAVLGKEVERARELLAKVRKEDLTDNKASAKRDLDQEFVPLLKKFESATAEEDPKLDQSRCEYLLSVMEWMPPNLIVDIEKRRFDPGNDLDIEALLLHSDPKARKLLVVLAIAMGEIDDATLERLDGAFAGTSREADWATLRKEASSVEGDWSKIGQLFAQLQELGPGMTKHCGGRGMKPSTGNTKQKLGDKLGKGKTNVTWEDFIVENFPPRPARGTGDK
ncbi:MAG: DUF4157 domain-containing protein [Actinomycetota bacterium]|jgi:hypothetical protein|nr:DUF4157 domain-containing protein [Actinomycetota bacterium]